MLLQNSLFKYLVFNVYFHWISAAGISPDRRSADPASLTSLCEMFWEANRQFSAPWVSPPSIIHNANVITRSQLYSHNPLQSGRKNTAETSVPGTSNARLREQYFHSQQPDTTCFSGSCFMSLRAASLDFPSVLFQWCPQLLIFFMTLASH